MKLFKRLLAVALIGVMALTVLAGCAKLDPNADDTLPDDQDIYNTYDKLINEASEAGHSSLTYSKMLSDAAWSMLVASEDAYGADDGEISTSKEDAAIAAFEKAKTDGVIPSNAKLCVGYLPTNPGNTWNFDYSKVYTNDNYDSSNRVGIAIRWGRVMIVTAYFPKTSK